MTADNDNEHLQAQLLVAVKKCDEEAVITLLDTKRANADAGAHGLDLTEAALIAARKGNMGVVQRLRSRGACMTKRAGDRGWTPFLGAFCPR